MRADSISRIVGLIGFAVGGFYLEERAPRLIRELLSPELRLWIFTIAGGVLGVELAPYLSATCAHAAENPGADFYAGIARRADRSGGGPPSCGTAGLAALHPSATAQSDSSLGRHDPVRVAGNYDLHRTTHGDNGGIAITLTEKNPKHRHACTERSRSIVRYQCDY